MSTGRLLYFGTIHEARAKLQEMLDLIRYAELTSKSTITQDEVDEFASEVNKGHL
ncbi:MAG: hypothetical protein AAGC64_11085 [Bacteroidota bacterium]